MPKRPSYPDLKPLPPEQRPGVYLLCMLAGILCLFWSSLSGRLGFPAASVWQHLELSLMLGSIVGLMGGKTVNEVLNWRQGRKKSAYERLLS